MGVEVTECPLGGGKEAAAVGALVAVEGLDGAGKRTLNAALAKELETRGVRVGTMAFPRYGQSVPADLVAEALHGRAGDLGESVHGMAALFALDRAAAVEELNGMRAKHDVVLLDRYAASNAAFGAARLHQDGRGEFAGWVQELEFGRCALPVPALQVLLRVPVAVAAARAVQRAGADDSRSRDAFERDDGLQARTAAVYDELAADGWASPWFVYAPDTEQRPDSGRASVAVLADRVLYSAG